MRDPPASIPEHWMMCKAARNFRAAVAGLTGLGEEGTNASLDGSMPFTKHVERMDGTSIEGSGTSVFFYLKDAKFNQNQQFIGRTDRRWKKGK